MITAAQAGDPSHDSQRFTGTVEIVHSYPDAFKLLERLDPVAVLVLHTIAGASSPVGPHRIARVPVSTIAHQLRAVSRNTVNRRLKTLIDAGLIEILPPVLSVDPTPTFRIDLASITPLGITVVRRPTATD